VVLRFALPLQTVDQELWEFRRGLWLASVAVLLVTRHRFVADLAVFSPAAWNVCRCFPRRVAEGDFRPD